MRGHSIFRAALLGLVALLLAVATPALAQRPDIQEGRVELADRMRAALDPLQTQLSDAERVVAQGDADEDALDVLRQDLRGIVERALARMVAFQPEIRVLDADIAAEPGTSRSDLTNRRASVSQVVQAAEQVSVRAAELATRIVALRRERFVGALTRRRDLSATISAETLGKTRAAVARIAGSFSDWGGRLVAYQPSRLALAFGIALAVGFGAHFVASPVRRWRDRLISRYRKRGRPIPALQRLTFAFAAVCVTGLLLALVAFTLNAAFHGLSLYRLRVDDGFRALLVTLSGLVFVLVLTAAILAPWAPHRRLVEIGDRPARRLFALAAIMATIYSVDLLFGRLLAIYSAPVELTITKSFFAALAIALVMLAAVLTPIHPKGEPRPHRGWNVWIYALIWAGVMAIAVAALTGYVSLARFIAGQFVVTGSVAVTMYLGFLVSRAIAEDKALQRTAIGRRMLRKGATDQRVEQVALMISIALNVLIVMVGLPIIALQWGFTSGDIWGGVGRGFAGFSVGGFEISFTKIAVGLIVFAVLYQLTRFAQRWFDRSVATRTRMDAGVRNSVRSGIGYVGFIVAALIGVSFAGLNLSNLAIIVGALSVGIGFGLQNIVNNFVSGIIMLIERPIKVGDYVAVSGSEGTVRKISVRATELETLDRQSVIVPNADFIGSVVLNWMHVDRVRRLILPVGVAYGSDTALVREVLQGILDADERIAKLPVPLVYFADFGASSLDFQLRFFIEDISDTQFVESEIRFAIDAAFREHDIEIPFPQSDLHLRSIDDDAAAVLAGHRAADKSVLGRGNTRGG